ncbi:hypothetical protein HXP44_31795 [Streptomyces sioyaensis]|uniref:Uncharacterized protein n=1 Tax=Streptomyces sioyaensis TaxID=67364 RepID=A0A4Q1QXW9_9ACTN|nr:hypothetical protein [Streptomyces sioyaensis]MBM4796493.1 hypothetical protein [Streptomyces sioyaensis]RXS64028.1 hypothetical protein EST54_23655 [Streptomyces sioyaensis]
MSFLPAPGPARRLALMALAVCVLSVAAAVVAFVEGSFFGIVWILLAGISSNMAWFYVRKSKQDGQRQAQQAGAAG